jgi:CyaY protein
MDEQDFAMHCEKAMDALYQKLLTASEEHDFEVDQGAGTITLEFEEPRAKFVVSPNSPVRQIWVSALTRSFKLDWNEKQKAFILPESGEDLNGLMGYVITRQMGETVTL